jgi:hypothetical protein
MVFPNPSGPQFRFAELARLSWHIIGSRPQHLASRVQNLSLLNFFLAVSWFRHAVPPNTACTGQKMVRAVSGLPSASESGSRQKTISGISTSFAGNAYRWAKPKRFSLL